MKICWTVHTQVASLHVTNTINTILIQCLLLDVGIVGVRFFVDGKWTTCFVDEYFLVC